MQMDRKKCGFSGTGGGPSNYCALTPLEQQVCDIFAINVSVHGTSRRKNFGAPTSTSPSTSPNFEITNESILLSSEYNLEKKN